MRWREEVIAIEEKIANKVESSIHELRELRQQNETHKELEKRIAKLDSENKTPKPTALPDDMDRVEKGRIVICSFRDMDGEKAEKLVHEVVLGVRGYQGASATNAAPLVVMAQFDSPAMAFESDPQPKLQSKNARTQIVGIRKSFPE